MGSMAIFNIITVNRHRLSTDGNGITTLVALAGCPLGCKYCINKDILNVKNRVPCSPEKLLEKAMIDYCYFTATGGGITFGGGEPLLHSEALLEFMSIKPADVSVVIETSLNHDSEHVSAVLDKADELIIDIKSMKPVIYKEYTGRDNSLTLKWLKYIIDNGLKDKCTIKVPNIPEFTSKEDIDDSVEALKDMGFENIRVFDYIIK